LRRGKYRNRSGADDACAELPARQNDAMTTTEPHFQNDAEPHSGDPAYAYKPSVMGAPWEFALTREGLQWRLGYRSGLIRYDQIRRVRMSYRPATMQSKRYVTEIWSAGQPKIPIASTSWRNIMEQQRQDAAYTAFVSELHRRLAETGSTAQFVAGVPAVSYWIGLPIFSAAMVALAILVVHAIKLEQWTVAALIAALFVAFAMQLGTYFRRNWPTRYRPGDLPARVLPRALGTTPWLHPM
jgi:hypothetical protein